MRRTPSQQAAIEVFCRNLAEALNDAGYDFNDGRLIRLPVSYTQDNVKEYLWKPVQQALFPDKKSTTQLETGDVSEVYDNLMRAIASRAGVYVPFPSQEQLEYERQMRDMHSRNP